MSEKPTPKVSVLLLTHDRYQLTKYILQKALSNPGISDFELLILDNGSSDERVKGMCNERDFPSVFSGSLTLEPENIGIAAGFNKLLKKAKGDHIAFIYNDILLSENWLSDLVFYSEQIDKSGLVSIHCEGEKGSYSPKLNRLSDDFTNVWVVQSGITTGVSLISRQALNAVGGFDESLGIYGKERENLAERLRRSGYNNFYVPGQYSIHMGRDTNEVSDYRKMKDKAFQIASSRHTASMHEMVKKNNYYIAI